MPTDPSTVSAPSPSRPDHPVQGWRARRDEASAQARRWSRSTPVLAVRKWSDDQCATRSAGIAFYAAFSIAPTLVMVIVVAGWFFGAAAVSGQLFHQLTGLMGSAAATEVQSVVAHAHRSGASGWATLLSFLVLAAGASATFSTLNQALNVVWPVPARSRAGSATTAVIGLVKVRLVSFGLVLGIAFLLIVSLILDAAVTFVGQWLWTNSPWAIVGDVVQTLVSVAVLTAAFATLIKFLPAAPVRWYDALVGGLAAAVLFAVGKKLFALYLVHAGLETSFGAAGSLAVLLMWLYFSAAVFLLGAEFAAVRAGHVPARQDGGEGAVR